VNAAQARNISVAALLAHFGFLPQRENGKEAWYRSPLRAGDDTPSFKVDKGRNAWFDHGLGRGGNCLDLACLLYGADVPAALDALRRSSLKPAEPILSDEAPQLPFESSPAPAIELLENAPLKHAALIQYVEKRGVPARIAAASLREIHYRSAGRNWFALGFANELGGFELRNAYFQGCLPPKAPTWIQPAGGGRLTVFEGFMDFLSWLTLHDRPDPPNDALVLNSLVYAPQVSERLKVYAECELYLDNDEAGRDAVSFFPNARNRSASFAPHKDLNEHLVARKAYRA